MELTEDIGNGLYRITAYGKQEVTINQQTYTHSLIVMPHQLLTPWQPKNIESLQAEDWACLKQYELEVVLLGTGSQLIFPHPEVTAPLVARQLGLEVMDTATCCRTYNILMAEERLVAAALLI